MDGKQRTSASGRFWLTYAAGWLALGLWNGVNAIVGLRNAGSLLPAWKPMSWELTSAGAVAVLAIAVARFERRVPLSGPGWSRRLPAHVPAVLAFSLLHTLAMVGLRSLVYAAQGTDYDFGDWRLGLVYEFQKDLITYAMIVGLCVGWRLWRERRAHELAVVRLQRDLAVGDGGGIPGPDASVAVGLKLQRHGILIGLALAASALLGASNLFGRAG